jgi:hypothetical protein
MDSLVDRLLQFDALEMALGAAVPPEYRRFLLEGSAPRAVTFVIGGETRTISRWYSIGAVDPLCDLLVRHASLRGIVPHHVLAIARDDRSDLVCIGISGKRLGTVYLVPVRRERGTTPMMRLLAPTFAAFVDPRSSWPVSVAASS